MNSCAIFEYFLPYESCLPKVDTKKLPWKTILPMYSHVNTYQVHPLRISHLRSKQYEKEGKREEEGKEVMSKLINYLGR